MALDQLVRNNDDDQKKKIIFIIYYLLCIIYYFFFIIIIIRVHIPSNITLYCFFLQCVVNIFVEHRNLLQGYISYQYVLDRPNYLQVLIYI
jgi:hypothetical protein